MVEFLLAFLGTNVDGFSCLAATFFVDPPRNRIGTILASAGAFAVVLCISLVTSLAIGRIGTNVSWFGLVPATIGIVRLLHLIFNVKAGASKDGLSGGPSVFSIVLATGADNVAVYAPLFALRSFSTAVAVSAMYLLLWASGCAALAFCTPDVLRFHALRRYLDPLLSIFFIVFGVSIVARW